jgi:dCMP deaminase
MKPSWHDTFFELCDVLAKRSDDLATKLGCVIIGPDKEVVATGYNGLPRGIRPTEDKLTRPAKYLWTEHAEKNAIMNATRYGATLKGCTLYCGWPPCAACARSIIQAGITHLHFKETTLKEKWRESMDVSMQMLYEAGVSVHVHSHDTIESWQVKPAKLTYKDNDPNEEGAIRN